MGYDRCAAVAYGGDNMDMTGEYRIPAAREIVWKALNDPETLRNAIPGCESLEKISDTEMTAKVAVKIGPVSAKFAGKITLSDLDPPNRYRITGEGQGGAAGFAKGTARVELEDGDAGDTILRYHADASVGGKMAQIGSRLVQGAAQKTANEFFGRFSELVALSSGDPAMASVEARDTPPDLPSNDELADRMAVSPVPASDAGRSSSKGLSAWAWIGGIVVIVALLLIWFAFAG
jgi:uncharacterized protein